MKDINNLHQLTIIACLLCLLLGVAVGWCLHILVN